MSSDALTSPDGQDQSIDPAHVLRGEHPEHRIRELDSIDDVRVVLEHETRAEPRKHVVAACNRRLDYLRSTDADPDELEFGEPSLETAREIAGLFDGSEVRDHLAVEKTRDEPRDAVIQALKERLEEVAGP